MPRADSFPRLWVAIDARRLRAVVALAAMLMATWALPAEAQQSASFSAGTSADKAESNEQLLQELRNLRKEVTETRKLQDQVIQLQNEVANLRTAAVPVFPGSTAPDPNSTQDAQSAVSRGGGPMPAVPGQAHFPPKGPPPDDNFPLTARYKYHYDAAGPSGGGGYIYISDPDEEFTFNITNQITIDSTNFDRQNMPTNEQGFNVPFARTFLSGNITKNWNYQIGTQGFLGTFNLLDMWMSYKFGDGLTIRAGKGLTPPLYEYIAFSPALEPVITNSPLFQLAAGRPIGVVALGSLFDNRMQYWSGITNPAKSTYYALNRNVNYNGQVDFTPFKGTEGILEGLGGGVGFLAGYQKYALNQGNAIGFTNNGEASTNSAWITSSGVPFAVYNPNVRANGIETQVAPHLYWYGRFSVLTEYMISSRELTDGTTTGRSTQRGYYVNLSYFLTGESDFKGNGFQGYSTVVPLRPFLPGQGLWGPGAWQLAAQFSESNVGRGDFERGFINTGRWTNRLDQLMVGVNWWPNKYTRLSFDYVWTGFNNPIPVNSPAPIQSFNTFWLRFAMFF